MRFQYEDQNCLVASLLGIMCAGGKPWVRSTSMLVFHWVPSLTIWAFMEWCFQYNFNCSCLLLLVFFLYGNSEKSMFSCLLDLLRKWCILLTKYADYLVQEDAKELQLMTWRREQRLRDAYLDLEDEADEDLVAGFLELINPHKR